MIDVIGTIVGGATAIVTGALVWYSHKHDPGDLPPAPKVLPWQAAKLPDGTWSVVTTDRIPQLGIDEQTVYGGYSHEDAQSIRDWLNDESDFRSLDQMLLDAKAKRDKAAEEMEARRLAGGDPVYVMGQHQPIDYVVNDDHMCAMCARPMAFHSDCGCGEWQHSTSADKDAEEYSHWTRKRLEGLARQRYCLTLAQMKLLSKVDLVRMLAYDEPPPAPGEHDIYTEYDLRQALFAWRATVKRNAPGEEWSIEQCDQLHFIMQRAEHLGLQHVLLSVMHSDPEVFNQPTRPSRPSPFRGELR